MQKCANLVGPELEKCCNTNIYSLEYGRERVLHSLLQGPLQLQRLDALLAAEVWGEMDIDPHDPRFVRLVHCLQEEFMNGPAVATQLGMMSIAESPVAARLWPRRGGFDFLPTSFIFC